MMQSFTPLRTAGRRLAALALLVVLAVGIAGCDRHRYHAIRYDAYYAEVRPYCPPPRVAVYRRGVYGHGVYHHGHGRCGRWR